MSTYPDTLIAPWLDRAAAVGLDIPDLKLFARSDGRMCVTGCKDCRNIRNQVRAAEQKAAAERAAQSDSWAEGYIEALRDVRKSIVAQHEQRIEVLSELHDITVAELDYLIARFEAEGVSHA